METATVRHIKHTCRTTEIPTGITDKRCTTMLRTSSMSSMDSGGTSSRNCCKCTSKHIMSISSLRVQTRGRVQAGRTQALLNLLINARPSPTITTTSSTCRWGHKGAGGTGVRMARRTCPPRRLWHTRKELLPLLVSAMGKGRRAPRSVCFRLSPSLPLHSFRAFALLLLFPACAQMQGFRAVS